MAWKGELALLPAVNPGLTREGDRLEPAALADGVE
jgi:hypothetical protein